MASVVTTNYWTKLPKFVHRKYASLVNIDIGTLLQITQQKTAKTMKKIFKKKIYFRPTDPNFFTIWNRNNRYFFLRLMQMSIIEIKYKIPTNKIWTWWFCLSLEQFKIALNFEFQIVEMVGKHGFAVLSSNYNLAPNKKGCTQQSN
jgi:hypothetical protein